MRVFETAADVSVLPEVYMVARIDGRSFTRLTKDVCNFEAPYDVRFRDLMVNTTKSLMGSGFDVIYAYTQSDEISLLFNRNENLFGRKLRKFNSVLAGQASASLSAELGRAAVFDCRVSQLPNQGLVIDYFQWRAADALRNALNSHCYWAMRNSGWNAKRASRKLEGKSVAEKNELLFSRFNLNFNQIPAWQKRGLGMYWNKITKTGTDPRTGQPRSVNRRQLITEFDLPAKDSYTEFLAARIASQACQSTSPTSSMR